MSIETQIGDQLKEAMRNKDLRTADCIRMIKTKHMERRTAAGFKGPLDDALWLEVIAAYQKQLRKAREEYANLGERGAEQVVQIDFEVEFCNKFLPKGATDDEIRAVVKAAVAATGITDPKQAGKVMGEAMKSLKGKAEPGQVKKILDDVLSKGA